MKLTPALFAPALLLVACAGTLEDQAYWRDYEREAIAEGRLRTDRAPPGLEVSPAQTLRNFREIFFYSEYGVENGEYVLRRSPIPLEKRHHPTTWRLMGDSVSDRDRRHVSDVADLIAEATGVAIFEASGSTNITIAIVDARERVQMANEMARDYGESALTRDLRNNLGDDVCVAVPLEPEDPDGDYDYLIIIPNEVGGVLRRACIEEEFAHAFGPSADYDYARPSIFNDDQEFALLTAHDLLLLEILYDQRLRSGMSEERALPVLRAVMDEMGLSAPDPAQNRLATDGNGKRLKTARETASIRSDKARAKPDTESSTQGR